VLGAVVPLTTSGISGDIKFTPEALAEFLGKIQKWNDSVIAQANPASSFPTTDHCGSSSDEAALRLFYRLLRRSARLGIVVGRGLAKMAGRFGRQGERSVAGQIRQLEGAIGYIELVYAVRTKLRTDRSERCRQFVKASLDT